MNTRVEMWSVFGLVAAVVMAGCGADGPPRGDVRGRVTVGGEPVENGAIVFVPVAGIQGAPVQFQIVNGEYASDVKGPVVGKNSVQISGARATGKQTMNMVTGEQVDVFEEIVPAKYNNDRSELSADIQAGENTFDFELDGKPRKAG
ncbi:hypothetical protein Pan44_54750 [Caulifigura coniformis]|uniref:Uncharacterized protein n=1 Tax=Caulifigura coniformis TaxID=2527983 RepID=A0A517SMS0_9PLAN|nr:hypothetical protein [Caulifigura coniformis]QDT57406.1 hypothetical protein Pan44_54750 [Caulifigura coniformis]